MGYVNTAASLVVLSVGALGWAFVAAYQVEFFRMQEGCVIHWIKPGRMEVVKPFKLVDFPCRNNTTALMLVDAYLLACVTKLDDSLEQDELIEIYSMMGFGWDEERQLEEEQEAETRYSVLDGAPFEVPLDA